MYVKWDLKKLSYVEDRDGTRHPWGESQREYSRIGDALNKMISLQQKGYGGVELHEVEGWYIGNTPVSGDEIKLREIDNAWWLTKRNGQEIVKVRETV